MPASSASSALWPGDQLAGRGLMRIGARGRKAEGAGADRRLGQAAHLGDVVRGGGLAVDAALAHDIDAQRMMRDLRRDIDRPRHAGQRVEIIREALPFPVQSFGQGRAGDVLDGFHQVDQLGAVLLAHRREADAAIAEQDRRDAMPGGGGQHRVPGRLAVVMGVDIDPAGGDQQPVGLDDPFRRTGLAANRDDPVALDRDIAGKARRASAVENGPAANDDVVHAENSDLCRLYSMRAPGQRHNRPRRMANMPQPHPKRSSLRGASRRTNPLEPCAPAGDCFATLAMTV